MNILTIAPTGREYADMATALRRAAPTRHSYTLIRSGIGKAAAAANTAAAIAESDAAFDMIAVVGFAAGSFGFRQGDIVMPDTARYHDCNIPEGFIPELTDPYALCGSDPVTVFTGDSFVDAGSVRKIKSRFGVERAIFDMETTAVAIAAGENSGIPVLAVKIVSDVPEEGHTELSYDGFADSHPDFSGILARIEDVTVAER